MISGAGTKYLEVTMAKHHASAAPVAPNMVPPLAKATDRMAAGKSLQNKVRRLAHADWLSHQSSANRRSISLLPAIRVC